MKKNFKKRNGGRRGESMKRKTSKKTRLKNRNRALRRKIKSRRDRVPTTARQYFARSRKFQETWDSVAHVISRMRDRVSLPKASREFGIAPSVVVKFARSALRKRKGRYVARKTDQLLRVVSVLSTEGKREIATRDSRQASVIGGHWAAVQKFLQTGDDSALSKFARKPVVDAGRKRYLLLTNLAELERQGSAGVLRFESLYAGSAQ